jgi:hypothetical protein
MELKFCHLHDDVVHIFEPGTEITVVLKLDMMSQIDTVLHHTSLVLTMELTMLMVAFDTGLNGKTSLSNANLTTFTGYTVCTHTVVFKPKSPFTRQRQLEILHGAEEI